nr:chemotaxis protein MotC [uncultured Gellertiella sp.]
MTASRNRCLVFAAALLATSFPSVVNAGDEELAPYKMLRSMQFVQDSVVLGDHSAAEMQRYLLGTIDKRLRAVDSSVFEDPRNVDATLIYTMSGGNPKTLEYLVARDVQGYFDNRVTEILRKYLSGKGQLVVNALSDMQKEYKDKDIGPYLALIAGNTLMNSKPEAALKMYNWARLTSPGTIVEEAALRRSMSIAVNAGMINEGLAYSNQYARRFLHSPYASQFADLFVALAVENVHTIGLDRIRDTVEVMDTDRKQAIYLRIARQATIAGESELAKMAAAEAAKIKATDGTSKDVLAGFYSGIADVSSENISKVAEGLGMVPDGLLSDKDKALREAARSVVEQVLKAPDPESLAQDTAPIPSESSQSVDANAAGDVLPVAGQTNVQGTQQPVVAHANAPGAIQASAPQPDPAIDPIVTSARSKLGEIDKLLEKDSSTP